MCLLRRESYTCFSEGPGEWLALQLDRWPFEPSATSLRVHRRVRRLLSIIEYH
jgi:hypothetical protein